jgi:hypothetical protein
MCTGSGICWPPFQSLPFIRFQSPFKPLDAVGNANEADRVGGESNSPFIATNLYGVAYQHKVVLGGVFAIFDVSVSSVLPSNYKAKKDPQR